MLPDFELCCSEFGRFGIELTEEQYRKFDIYAQFLVEYNEKVNLTAITDPLEVLRKHFIDSAMLLKYCDIPSNAALIDVGTGAGFPSVPMKILREDIQLTLLDSLAKRLTFLEQLCDKLSIKAELVHARAEDCGKMPKYREKFDVATARAVANLAVLSEYCIPFVKEDGIFTAMKGPNEDIQASSDAIEKLGGELEDVLTYEFYEESRRIAVIRKVSQTPSKYPRNSGQIKKKSL